MTWGDRYFTLNLMVLQAMARVPATAESHTAFALMSPGTPLQSYALIPTLEPWSSSYSTIHPVRLCIPHPIM